jgi:hypothetical protein
LVFSFNKFTKEHLFLPILFNLLSTCTSMSCLFNSLGRIVGVDPTQVRHDICEYMSTNPSFYDDGTRAETVVEWTTGGTIDTYVRDMRKASTWGSALEIRSFCDMTGIPVYVYDMRSSPPQRISFVPVHGHNHDHDQASTTAPEPIHLWYNGFHYEPLTSPPPL